MPQAVWTKRLLTINFLIFVALTLTSGEFFSPHSEYLIMFGAKEPLHLAAGQWWRLVTPIFLHIGILHFALNSLALKYVGRYVELQIGGPWFLAVYLLSGILANVASSLTNIEIGAGASGAIFGLIGVGVVFEWIVNIRSMTSGGIRQWLKTRPTPFLLALRQTLIPGPFSSMAILNIALAVGVNFVLGLSADSTIGIDNAAHLGGLVAGMVSGFALLCLRRNSLLRRRAWLGGVLIACQLAAIGGGLYLVTQTDIIEERFFKVASASPDPARAFSYLSRALVLSPDDERVRMARGRLLLLNGESSAAYADFSYLHSGPEGQWQLEFENLALELGLQGRQKEAAQLRAFSAAKLAGHKT